MQFSEIIGQHDIKTRFVRSVAEQRIPHAQLLRGQEGVGKLALAIAYAQFICCENRHETDSCGLCPSCIKYKKLAHPDLHFVFPVIKPANKGSVVCDDYIADFRAAIIENPYISVNNWYARISGDQKQGLIYSNESEEIIRKLSLKTYESEYKVMIIWLPEKMHVNCANKLLKILEEPPEKTVFLLVSNTPDEIISTILSRTQHINIPKLTEDDIVLALLRNSEIDITQQEAVNVSRIANGSLLNAFSILSEGDENKQNFDRFVMIMRLAWQVGNRKDHASLKTLKKWADDIAASAVGRERQKNFLTYSQRMTRENFILNMQHPELNYLTTFESEFSSRFSPFIHERNVEDLMKEFALAERHIEQNVNAKMVFFDLVLKVIMLLKR
ncbi:MAG: DNA polymerase III subunit delta [Paludibacter sp.]|nr:DNA polymerase III subunit delta [Paludibacter sp.]